jgi:hypothetical protein
MSNFGLLFANDVLVECAMRRGLTTTSGGVQAQRSRAQEENVVEELEDEADLGRHHHCHPGRHRSGHLGRHQAQGLNICLDLLLYIVSCRVAGRGWGSLMILFERQDSSMGELFCASSGISII